MTTALEFRLSEVEASTKTPCPSCKMDTKGIWLCKICGKVKK